MKVKRKLPRSVLFFIQLVCVLSCSQIAKGLVNQSSDGITGRIVNGVTAPTNAAPYIVSIQNNGMHYCAGSILNSNWVLTAAHCLAKKSQIANSILIAGSNNVNGNSATVQKCKVTKYLVHDLYLGGTKPYDIGLIYTSTGFKFTAAVKPVSLPTSNVYPSGYANLYGWGATKTSPPTFPTELQVANNIPIISLSACRSAYPSKAEDIHDTSLCTGGSSSASVSICSADSGGPLVQHSGSQTVLIGVVSWGTSECGKANSPSVYVRVSAFLKWITDSQKL